MIPERIKLSGFLCYRDEQEISFSGAALWMLYGANGSGKSTVFDAVTYALFGCHRAGSQNAAELINKDCTSLEVEFDFTLDGQLYRIRRTLKKLQSGVKGTVQILHSSAGGEWAPLPDTSLKRGFDDWIARHLGLNFETFTSSVLLLQGRAEKLLDAQPSGRASVLASIVNLERFQKLHAIVEDRRKKLRTILEETQNQLSALPEVSEQHYAQATFESHTTEATREQKWAELEHLQETQRQAERWRELQSRLAVSRQRLAADEALLTHADTITRQYQRFRELREVLPAVSTIISERGRVIESQRKSERLRSRHKEERQKYDKLEHEFSTVRDKMTSLKARLANDESQAVAINAKLRELVAEMEQVRMIEEQQAEIRRLEMELSQLPADAEDRLCHLLKRLESLTVLARSLPLLMRFVEDRSALCSALSRLQQTQAEESHLLEEGRQTKAEYERAQNARTKARSERESADAAVAETRALLHQAERQLEEFQKLDGEKHCRVCGQRLTHEHYIQEFHARRSELDQARQRLQNAVSIAKEKHQREAEAAAEEEALRRRLEELRERYRDRAAEARQAASDVQRLQASLEQTYQSLPETYRLQISPQMPLDWNEVLFPTEADLDAFQKQAASTDLLRRESQALQTSLNRREALMLQIQLAQDRLTKLRPSPSGRTSILLRQEYAAAQAEESAITHAIQASKNAINQAEREIDRLQLLVREAERSLTVIEGELRQEELSRTQSQETISRLTQGLPDSWKRVVETAGLSEQLRWKEEFEALQTEDIEGRYTRLQSVATNLQRQKDAILELEEAVNTFPEEHRRPVEEIENQIQFARQQFEEIDRSFLVARQTLGLLEVQRQRRAELQNQVQTLEGEYNNLRLLAELLGRDRLQRHLLRRAECQIVDYANAMLDRLSSGQLFLRIVDQESGTDKALDLVCVNRSSGDIPIHVAFLSGSQRFRVAVSLALGIGQYASSQQRPIECVIIDEGFGCLDRNGRQVMIQELQNLRVHLRRILLVSHQEEFADAFPNRYHFEHCNGTTQITRCY